MSGTTRNPLSPMPGGDPTNMPGAPAPRPGAVGPRLGMPMPGQGPGPSAGPPPVPPVGPTGGPPPGPSPDRMPTSFDEAKGILETEHGRAKAAYELSSKALGKMELIKGSLSRLAKKGDVVQQEDVIEEAGKLVSRGIDPFALAGILADMPQEGGGEALAGWVQGHAAQAAATEQQLKINQAVSRHDLGVGAMNMLRGHAVGMAIQPQAGEPGGPPSGPPSGPSLTLDSEVAGNA